MCRVTTVTIFAGAFTFARVFIEYKWSYTYLDCWALTLASFFVKNLRSGTVLLFQANTVTFVVTKHLLTWAVLPARTDAFAVTIAILEW